MGSESEQRPCASPAVLLQRGFLFVKSKGKQLLLLALLLLIVRVAFHSGATQSRQHTTSKTASMSKTESKPNGVFVIKASDTRELHKTLCTLTAFFNGKAKYPIRIFVDHKSETDATITKYTGDADVKVIFSEKWKDLPDTLTPNQRLDAMSTCTDFNDKEKARCTSLKRSLGYVHMTYWSYMKMQDEPALQDYEYFVLFDDDAFLTRPMPDPFQIMQQNNLVGIFNIESFEFGSYTSGIQEASEAVFSKQERRNAYLDSPKYWLFDKDGTWGGSSPKKPGMWACFYGGRLDFMRSKRYKDFALRVVPHTYTKRTSVQSVIAVAWAIMASDKVWYLPQRGYEMGVYHHGWVDNSEILRTNDTATPFKPHTLDRWDDFEENRPASKMLRWREYVEALGHGPDIEWKQCGKAKGRAYGS